MSGSSATASTAASSAEDTATDEAVRVRAIHQPNFFPRLSTLAKLFAAQEWIILDTVQFTRRDYQNRARLAELDRPDTDRLLTLPVHLTHGRSTRIRDTRLVDPAHSARKVNMLIRQYYRRSSHWSDIKGPLASVVDTLGRSDDLSLVSTVSTSALLRHLGWRGTIVPADGIPARSGRTERLVDLTAATGGTHYLCGPGGLRYLDERLFTGEHLTVIPFRTPVDASPPWVNAHRLSALWAMAQLGADTLATALRSQRDLVLGY
ncbi:MAG: WbqC family protein [Actinobacteria bacterium]|nr:WbqC family protein [Actinomycetota bacterium]